MSMMSNDSMSQETRAVVAMASNTPFVSRPLNNGCSKNEPKGTANVVPFDTMGYQCMGNQGCGTVNQWTFQPGANYFFSAQQCAQVCGGMSATTYRPPSAFL
jgi:hypothetical protein